MTMSQNPVVLTKASIDAGSEEVVDANVHVVNAMYGKLLDAGEIAPAALGSYYVDFYVTQSLEGGFAQYVFTADRDEVDPLIREGLAGMGATAHLELFNRTVAAFDALSEEDEERYLDGDLDTEEESTDAVRTIEELDGEFEEAFETENITALNAAWLLSQEGLLVLDDEELDAYIERQVALIPNLEERQAAADEEALEDAPDFEVIIRELCDIAGYTLQKITMGDPNYMHDGEKTLAWHFTTDHGDFIMVEDDEEAFMINPETQEIVAAVEFEEADDDEMIDA
ncbi:DMP19 family protein [Pseudarthrobacter cellobiosi]|uniref:DMP19 family protein n=1 Tax=Pseudarthrobacter cellobiosi TaxID=2953654 RepID=UPI00208FA369|nr:DMP19 family protein [Pseudarthrobacter sp. HLT1-5]MCO4256263.1 DMP19 family protein [Pseudarthrobacter sp. HLT1-5]